MRIKQRIVHWIALPAAVVLSCVFSSESAAAVADSFQRPFAVSGVSQPVGEYSSYYCGNHLGQDLPQSPGTEVRAIANGTVRYSGNVTGLGHAVHIEHVLPEGNRVVSVYYHLKRLGAGGNAAITVGSEVTKGVTVIGYVTGVAADYGTGPHLHLGIRNGAYDARTDTRTEKWFYPGYSAIFVSGERYCDQSDPRHAQITGEWIGDALAYIDARPGATANLVTYAFAGYIANMDADAQVAWQAQGVNVSIGSRFSGTFTYNADAPRTRSSPLNYFDGATTDFVVQIAGRELRIIEPGAPFRNNIQTSQSSPLQFLNIIQTLQPTGISTIVGATISLGSFTPFVPSFTQLPSVLPSIAQLDAGNVFFLGIVGVENTFISGPLDSLTRQ